jgi:hypothetical protein
MRGRKAERVRFGVGPYEFLSDDPETLFRDVFTFLKANPVETCAIAKGSPAIAS